jgi:hypothetical protein
MTCFRGVVLVYYVEIHAEPFEALFRLFHGNSPKANGRFGRLMIRTEANAIVLEIIDKLGEQLVLNAIFLEAPLGSGIAKVELEIICSVVYW